MGGVRAQAVLIVPCVNGDGSLYAICNVQYDILNMTFKDPCHYYCTSVDAVLWTEVRLLLQLIAPPVGAGGGVHGAGRVPLAVHVIVPAFILAFALFEILLDPVTAVPAARALAAAIDALLLDAVGQPHIDEKFASYITSYF